MDPAQSAQSHACSLDSFIEFVGDACFAIDATGILVAVNEAALSDYGYSREEFLGMPALDLCTSVSEWVFERALPMWVKSGQLFDIEQHRCGGLVFTAEFRATEFIAEQGAVTVLTMREVTELREAQEELELKSLMLEGSLDAIVVYRPDGELVYFNHSASELLGLTPDEFALLGPYGWVGPQSRDQIPEQLKRMREDGDARFDSCSLRKDGSMVCTEVHARLVDTLKGDLVIAIMRDITERVRAQEHIAHLAYHDSLTGLPNRALLEQRLLAATASAMRHGDLVGVVFVDLDEFKPVNDTHGHAIGDAVLQVLAERMGMCVRDYDTLARLGGDEFLVLLPRLSRREDLSVVAFKIARSIREPIPLGDITLNVSASVGLAVYEPGEALDKLIQRADAEMYRAKQQDLPGWEVFLGENPDVEQPAAG